MLQGAEHMSRSVAGVAFITKKLTPSMYSFTTIAHTGFASGGGMANPALGTRNEDCPVDLFARSTVHTERGWVVLLAKGALHMIVTVAFVAQLTKNAKRGRRVAFFTLQTEFFLFRVAMRFLAKTAHNCTSWRWVAFPNAHHAHDVACAVDGFTYNAVYTRWGVVAWLRTQATLCVIFAVHAPTKHAVQTQRKKVTKIAYSTRHHIFAMHLITLGAYNTHG